MTKRMIKSLSALALCAGMAGTAGMAQDNQSALTAGMGWSSVHGTVASIGLEAKDIRGSGVDVGVDMRRGDTGNGGRIRLRYSAELGDTAFGSNTQADVRLSFSGSDWQDQAFSSETSRLSAGLAAGNAGGLTYRANVFWQTDNHFDARAAASLLVLAELGHSTAGGFVLGAGVSTLDAADLLSRGYSFDGSVTASVAGDRRFTALDLRASTALPMGDAGAFVIRAETGRISGNNGQTVSIHDRAFMGGTAPRGFAVGGAGPRDFFAATGIDSPLGGNRYVFASFEARRQVNQTLTLGAFVDTGASWDLDGAPVGNMGAIDDSLHMRTSAGVSLYWSTGIGTLRLSVADAVEKQANDQLNPVAFELVSSF